MTIGTRFQMDCTLKPIARLDRLSESPISAKMAGWDMLLQVSTSNVPRTTTSQREVTR